MGPRGCPETSVTKYRYTVRKAPEEYIAHLHRDGRLKSLELNFVRRSQAVMTSVLELWLQQSSMKCFPTLRELTPETSGKPSHLDAADCRRKFRHDIATTVSVVEVRIV
jgi:hypothetical protein